MAHLPFVISTWRAYLQHHQIHEGYVATACGYSMRSTDIICNLGLRQACRQHDKIHSGCVAEK